MTALASGSFFSVYPIQGCAEAGAYPGCHRMRDTRWTGYQSVVGITQKDRQPFNMSVFGLRGGTGVHRGLKDVSPLHKLKWNKQKNTTTNNYYSSLIISLTPHMHIHVPGPLLNHLVETTNPFLHAQQLSAFLYLPVGLVMPLF